MQCPKELNKFCTIIIFLKISIPNLSHRVSCRGVFIMRITRGFHGNFAQAKEIPIIWFWFLPWRRKKWKRFRRTECFFSLESFPGPPNGDLVSCRLYAPSFQALLEVIVLLGERMVPKSFDSVNSLNIKSGKKHFHSRECTVVFPKHSSAGNGRPISHPEQLNLQPFTIFLD